MFCIKVCGLALIFVFLNVKAEINKDNGPTSEYQNALNNLISRLGSHNQSSDNLVFMPPTFSVDIVSLLRWAVENTQAQPCYRNSDSSFRKENTPEKNLNDKYYNKNLLDLLQFNGKSYFFARNQKLPWVDAMQFCRAFDMELVSVETVQEDDFLIQQLNKIGLTKSFVWMSGNKIGRSTLMWTHGQTMIYENWGSGEPSHPATEHCMMFYQSKWYDVSCLEPSFFICEER